MFSKRPPTQGGEGGWKLKSIPKMAYCVLTKRMWSPGGLESPWGFLAQGSLTKEGCWLKVRLWLGAPLQPCSTWWLLSTLTLLEPRR